MASSRPRARNPYNNLGVVREASMFFGRKRELEHLFAMLAARQSVSVIGSSRIGKSSLLGCLRLPEIQQQFEDDVSSCIMVLIDLKEYLYKTREDFFTSICEHIISQAQHHLKLTYTPTKRDSQDEFINLIHQINTQGYHLTLLMDAFDNVVRNAEFNEDFLAFLRSPADWGRVSYVTASVAPLSVICHENILHSPFFNIFASCVLGPLTEEEAGELITRPANGLFTAKEVEWVIELAGRHPSLIQRVCSALFDAKSHTGTQPIKYSQIKNQVYEQLLSHFESVWRHLTAQQQEALKREARISHAPSRALPEWSESDLFRMFVRAKCGVNQMTMTVEDVETALKHLEKGQMLGEGPLSYLNSVTQRLKERNNLSPTAIERGVAVREVLNAAFERMRGPGLRTDSAYEWRLYNVLYYRYFKYHFRNEQIQARLGVEERQFFRNREDAIQMLYNMLAEQEASLKGEEPLEE